MIRASYNTTNHTTKKANKQKNNLLPLLYFYVFIVFTVAIEVVQADEYWPTIKKLLIQCGEADGRAAHDEAYLKFRHYLDALSADQLIEAGRQCSQAADAIEPGTVYCKESFYLVQFFEGQYPKLDELKDIEPMLKEIKDRNQTNLWRITLIDYLDNSKWMKLLSDEQMYSVVDVMKTVILGETEHDALRYEAIKTLQHILGQLERHQLLTDPIVQMQLTRGVKLEKIKKEINHGQLKLSDNYKRNQARLLRCYGDFSQTLFTIIDEPGANPSLQQATVSGLHICSKREHACTDQVKSVLEDSFRNYKRFDFSIWDSLLYVGDEVLQLPDADEIAGKMLSEIQRIYENEKDKKTGHKIKSQKDSIERIIKSNKKKD